MYSIGDDIGKTPGESLDCVLVHLEKLLKLKMGQKIHIPIAIVVSKEYAFSSNLNINKPLSVKHMNQIAISGSEQTEQYLINNGFGNIVKLIKSKFSCYKFFFTNAFSQKDQFYKVTSPFTWLFYQKKVWVDYGRILFWIKNITLNYKLAIKGFKGFRAQIFAISLLLLFLGGFFFQIRNYYNKQLEREKQEQLAKIYMQRDRLKKTLIEQMSPFNISYLPFYIQKIKLAQKKLDQKSQQELELLLQKKVKKKVYAFAYKGIKKIIRNNKKTIWHYKGKKYTSKCVAFKKGKVTIQTKTKKMHMQIKKLSPITFVILVRRYKIKPDLMFLCGYFLQIKGLHQLAGTYYYWAFKNAYNNSPLFNYKNAIWEKCWKNTYFDFTQDVWRNLSIAQQKTLAKMYQHWYAQTYRIDIKKVIKKNNTLFVFRLIPPGKINEDIISKGFYMGETEVTQEQWKSVMAKNPYFHFGHKKKPVGQVSWNSCLLFCKKMSFYIPTQAQWEYACRAGTTAPYNRAYISPKTINYNKHYHQTTKVKKLYNKNSWGCYDFHGNIAEWCYGKNNVISCGGSWKSSKENICSFSREKQHIKKVSPTIGLRVLKFID